MASNQRLAEINQDTLDQQPIPSSVRSLFVWPEHIAQMQSKQREQPTELSTPCLDLSNCSVSVHTSDSVADPNQAIEISSKSSMEDEGKALESSTNPQVSDGKLEASFLMNLIQEVRKYLCVWDISMKSYKNKPKMMEAWRRISTSLKVPGNV